MKHRINTDRKKMEWWSIGVMAGKWTGFSRLETALTRLFPHKSTQVVDFPRMCNVSIFWGGARNSRTSGRGMIGREMAKRSLEPRLGSQACGIMQKKLRVFTHFSAVFHDFTHRTRPYLRDFTHFYGCDLFFRGSGTLLERIPDGISFHRLRLCGVTGRSGLHKFAKVAFCEPDL